MNQKITVWDAKNNGKAVFEYSNRRVINAVIADRYTSNKESDGNRYEIEIYTCACLCPDSVIQIGIHDYPDLNCINVIIQSERNPLNGNYLYRVGKGSDAL